jgi:hypothetical protein
LICFDSAKQIYDMPMKAKAGTGAGTEAKAEAGAEAGDDSGTASAQKPTREFDVIVFGATGFTGKEVVR